MNSYWCSSFQCLRDHKYNSSNRAYDRRIRRPWNFVTSWAKLTIIVCLEWHLMGDRYCTLLPTCLTTSCSLRPWSQYEKDVRRSEQKKRPKTQNRLLKSNKARRRIEEYSFMCLRAQAVFFGYLLCCTAKCFRQMSTRNCCTAWSRN